MSSQTISQHAASFLKTRMIVEEGRELPGFCAMQAARGLDLSVEQSLGVVQCFLVVAEMESEAVEERMEVDVDDDVEMDVDIEMGDATEEEEDVEMTDEVVQEDVEMHD